ncbi:uncharacterized protein METZ01_LOCUS460342, partial [marine metagenome]
GLFNGGKNVQTRKRAKVFTKIAT